jgi:AcrR family transcriptional regulator
VATRSERTRQRLTEVALALFARDGYDQTTVAQIAEAAGVTQMTFFRHFPAKERLLLDDPYDPLMAKAVAAQPASLDPLTRVVRGARAAWHSIPAPEGDLVRERVRIAASTPSLRAAMWRNTAESERVIVEQLVASGTAPLPARIAAAATMAALTAALLEWSLDEEGSELGAAIDAALDVLEVRRA